MLLKFSAIPPLGGATGQTVGGCDWTGFSAASWALRAKARTAACYRACLPT